MRKVVISTTGTSILPGFFNERKNKELLRRAGQSETDKAKLVKRAGDIFCARVKDLKDRKLDIEGMSAEINCLSKIGIEPGDFLYFLVTETLDGKICGDLVADFCRGHFRAECFVENVPGLQVHDARLFEREGLNNFLNQVLDIRARRQGYEIILNPTGGFKAVVPYTTLLGLVFGLSSYYIFEHSGQVIRLPAAPIEFDLKVLESLTPVIGDLRDDYMDLTQFLEKTNLTRDRLDTLAGAIVVEEEQVSLSPLGRLLYERYIRQKGYEWRLSRQAEKKLVSGGYDRQTFERIFEKMTDPVHLISKLHNEVRGKNVDLDCYKGGNTNERVFYYRIDRVVMICDVFMHDEYERVINKSTILKKDYDFV
jgi:putative CRISPR-associated protein (TIGR02619 family)